MKPYTPIVLTFACIAVVVAFFAGARTGFRIGWEDGLYCAGRKIDVDLMIQFNEDDPLSLLEQLNSYDAKSWFVDNTTISILDDGRRGHYVASTLRTVSFTTEKLKAQIMATESAPPSETESPPSRPESSENPYDE